MNMNDLELAKKFVDVLGKDKIQSLITSLEKMKNPGYRKLYLEKSSESNKINVFLNRYHDYLLFTEDYISAQLDIIIGEYDAFRTTKNDQEKLTLQDIQYISEQQKLNEFPKILRTSLLIALCSYIEEVLTKKGIENHKSNTKFTQLSGHSVFESAKIILKDNMGIKNIEKLNWDYFIDLFKIRNDLVHNGGRINKSNNINLNIYQISSKDEYLIINKESLESIFEESKKFINEFCNLVIMDI